MILAALILFFGFVTCDKPSDLQSPKGFYPILVNSNSSRNENRTGQYQQEPEYFVLTKEGTLQRIQLVFPNGVNVQQQEERDATNFVLTPDGRLEKISQGKTQEQSTEDSEPVEYFKLTTEGRFQRIQREDLPQEENGEYHVLLPNGRLQRVRFMTVAEANKLTSRVSYQEVEPIRGPVYTYSEPLVRIV